MATVASGMPIAAEMVVAPVDRPEPDAIAPDSMSSETTCSETMTPESHDDVTSDHEPKAPAPLSADAALDGTSNGEMGHGPETVPPAMEPAEIESTLPALGVDVVSPALAALQPLPAFEDAPFLVTVQAPKAAALNSPALVPTDLTAAGATLQAFLLNEGLAALAHWRTLSKSRSPAEALRLQVDEMQRAADASITCMGRIAGHLGRLGAANGG